MSEDQEPYYIGKIERKNLTTNYELGKIAYDAYCEEIKKSLSRTLFPEFHNLTDDMIQSWVESALAVERKLDRG